MGDIVDLTSYRRRKRKAVVYFSRGELNTLLSLFSRRVLLGEWLDYSIDTVAGYAAFCVYRRAHDAPLYEIVRLAPSAQNKGDYVVLHRGQTMRRGRSLDEVLGVLSKPLRAVRR
ncbi:MAG: DUF2794 domain-containing protein [Alphaproteobacteria bacterium]|nr:DUF2794 domain-containing protein [Alphaproteobacteria bacterium]